MTINYIILLQVRDDVTRGTSYRPHQVLKLTTTSRQRRQALSMQLKKACLMPLLPLCSVPFPKLTYLVPPHAASLVGTALVKAFITATLCVLHEVGRCLFRHTLHRRHILSCTYTLFIEYCSYCKLRGNTSTRFARYVRQWDHRTWCVRHIFTTLCLMI